MNTLWRLLKHRAVDETDARRAFGRAALQRVAERVAASETTHSGELRVCIEAGLPLSYLWRGATARERAVAMFGKLRVWDTEHNNGVLVYLLLAERRIEIVADRGIDRRVAPAVWDGLVASMAGDFAAGRFENGLNLALDSVTALLRDHFPAMAGDASPNELPDAPLVL